MKTAGPSALFTEDHRHCDAVWAELEQAPDERRLELWRSFDASLRRHFAMEEEVLFPAIEDATGMHGPGPTMVMRMEHGQMRALLDQMEAAAASGDLDAVIDHGDTLLMLIQQHNVKEEGMLYPIADRALGSQWDQLEERLSRYST